MRAVSLNIPVSLFVIHAELLLVSDYPYKRFSIPNQLQEEVILPVSTSTSSVDSGSVCSVVLFLPRSFSPPWTWDCLMGHTIVRTTKLETDSIRSTHLL